MIFYLNTSVSGLCRTSPSFFLPVYYQYKQDLNIQEDTVVSSSENLCIAKQSRLSVLLNAIYNVSSISFRWKPRLYCLTIIFFLFLTTYGTYLGKLFEVLSLFCQHFQCYYLFTDSKYCIIVCWAQKKKMYEAMLEQI